MTTATKNVVHALNRLLRGEISAVETYNMAMEKVGDDPGAAEIRQMRDDHREAANTLRQHVHQFGGEPDQDSGVWGGFAKAVQATAKFFGDAGALRALKEGEEHGIKDFEDALNEKDLPAECRTLISGRLLPKCREHVATLDRLMNRK